MARRIPIDEIPPEYTNDDGGFKQGFDARYMTDLICAHLGLDNPGRLRQYTADEALARIEAQGWEHHLALRKASIERREEKTRPRPRAGRQSSRARLTHA